MRSTRALTAMQSFKLLYIFNIFMQRMNDVIFIFEE
jgi:hypothetical protein